MGGNCPCTLPAPDATACAVLYIAGNAGIYLRAILESLRALDSALSRNCSLVVARSQLQPAKEVTDDGIAAYKR